MRKLLPVYHANDQLEDNHPGCMWGIFHVLDYHHWHDNVRKMLPHRRHNKRKHAKRNKSPKAILGVHDAGQVQKLLDAEASHFLVNQRTTETSSTHKRSLKARIKALVAEEIRKEDDHKKRGSKFPARSRLGRTLSIHHLESSDHDFNKANTEWRNPIIFLPKKATPDATKLQHPAKLTTTEWKRFDMCTAENLMDYLGHPKPSQNDTFSQEKCNEAWGASFNQALKKANQLMQNGSHRQLKEYVDVLELYQVNKELFQEFQQNTDVGKSTCFEMPQASNTKARLTKSGSFPVADLLYSYSRNFKPSKLKHKQTEIWSFPRGEKFHGGIQAPESLVPKYSEDPCTKSGPVIGDGSESSLLNKETNCSLSIAEESVDQGCSKVVTPLKDNRQRIEFVFNEDDNESSCMSSDKTSTSGKEMTGMWETSIMDDNSRDSLSCCRDTSSSFYDLSKGTPRHRRTSSLNESLHRYAHLFEYSFSMKTNWNKSKSLKLTNEYEISSGGSAPISFKRNRSLPHVDSYWQLQNEESHDTFYPAMSSRTALASRINTEDNIQSESRPVGLPVAKNEMECLPLDAKKESEHSDNIAERSDCSPEAEHLKSLTLGTNDGDTDNMDGQCEGIDELTEQNSSYKDQKFTFIEIDGNMVPEPSPALSIIGSCIQEEVTSLTEISTSEGLEYNYNYSDERESPLNLLDSSDTGIFSQSCSTTYPENLENSNKSVKNHNHIELHTDDDADLNYVREVLDRAGFNENGFHAAWYSSDQPLSPLIFDEVEESWWPHEAECSEENINIVCRHQLLFDLVNEVILQIYETSFTYYPRALSSSCRVHPMHGRFHDEEVLKSISKSLLLKPELDQPPDDPVTQDYAKDDGWMNLQMESECVALELEDLIFDELLEELVCS